MKLEEWVEKAFSVTKSDALSWKLASATLNMEVADIWNKKLEPEELSLLNLALRRYMAGEPPTRIAGRSKFCGRWFKIGPEVLDPRPETEMLVEEAMKLKPFSVLELGTGSGCIVCSVVLQASHEIRALGVDISHEALKVAKRNAALLGAKCEFRISDWCLNVQEKFDLVLGNPPYLKSFAQLPKDVWPYDPSLALDGGVDGCEAHRQALRQLPSVLNPRASVLWEIGADQKKWILGYAREVFPDAKEILVLDDYNGRPRLLKVCT